MLRKLLYFGMMIALFGCASTTDSFHAVLGTENKWGFASQDNPEVLLDATIDRLRIRHVRLSNEKCTHGFSEHLELHGPIGPESTEAVKRLLPSVKLCLDDNPFSRTVYLSSGGGLLIDGLALGILLREHKMLTRLAPGQVCASSCAVAFLGGRYRTMLEGSTLIFHSPYSVSGRSIDCTNPLPVNALREYYAMMLDASDAEFLMDRTLSYCSSSDGWTVNADAAKLLGIVHEVVKP